MVINQTCADLSHGSNGFSLVFHKWPKPPRQLHQRLPAMVVWHLTSGRCQRNLPRHMCQRGFPRCQRSHLQVFGGDLWDLGISKGKFSPMEVSPAGFFPTWIYIYIYTPLLEKKRVMGNIWKWNPSNFWLLKVFLKKTDLEMDWACNLSLF